MAVVRDFEELAIFQKARELSKKIYPITQRGEFKYDTRFVQQIRAAVGSIMDNIAEGFERTGNKEFLNFLYIAKGSCGEVRSQLIRANDLGYLTKEEYDELYTECRKLSAGIMNFIKEIRTSEYAGAKYKEFNGSKVQED
jgi:four helix bundle protein